jgi:orotidine-5'-phosphate decarboxylase
MVTRNVSQSRLQLEEDAMSVLADVMNVGNVITAASNMHRAATLGSVST